MRTNSKSYSKKEPFPDTLDSLLSIRNLHIPYYITVKIDAEAGLPKQEPIHRKKEAAILPYTLLIAPIKI